MYSVPTVNQDIWANKNEEKKKEKNKKKLNHPIFIILS